MPAKLKPYIEWYKAHWSELQRLEDYKWKELEKLQKEFDELTDQISEEDKNELVRRTSVDAFFTAEKRINDVCKYIVTHFREYVEPTGMKAQVVFTIENAVLSIKRHWMLFLEPMTKHHCNAYCRR